MAYYIVRAKPKPERLAELNRRLGENAFLDLRPFGKALTHSLNNAKIDARWHRYLGGRRLLLTAPRSRTRCCSRRLLRRDHSRTRESRRGLGTNRELAETGHERLIIFGSTLGARNHAATLRYLRHSAESANEFIASNPCQPTRRLGLLIGPPSNPICTWQIARKLILQRSSDLAGIIPVTLTPSGQMIDMRHAVPLFRFCMRLMASTNGMILPQDHLSSEHFQACFKKSR